MFSDGRQCTMGRSDIHPSLCPYHSEREDQLFGTPSSGGSVVGAAFDLPELYSACRDLTTAAGVNRALAQVFRLLAQRRISRQEAATFAKLGHLLLQTISAARTDPASPPRKGYHRMRFSRITKSSRLPAKVMGIRSFRRSTKSIVSEGRLPRFCRMKKPSRRPTPIRTRSRRPNPDRHSERQSGPRNLNLSMPRPLPRNLCPTSPVRPLMLCPPFRTRCQSPTPPKTHLESTHPQLL